MDAGNGYGPFVIEFPEECRPRAERRILWKLGVYGVAGHTLGHYLSAVAQQYASTGDERFKQRVDYIVHELDSCQQYFVNGFIGGMPGGDRVFKQVKKGIIRSGRIRFERLVGSPGTTNIKP